VQSCPRAIAPAHSKLHNQPKVTAMNNVTIYTTPTCPYCLSAKALLKQKQVTYTEISVEGDRSAAVALAQRTGRRTVPQIFVGTTHVGGYDDLRALEEAGRLDGLLGR
jgi:glutaredoxin 3